MKARAAVLKGISRYFLVCLFLLFYSCSQNNTLRKPVLPQATVDAFASLNENALHDFDVNAYFTVLDRLSMEPGYVLDYVYVYSFEGGGPIIYARQSDQPALASYEELLAAERGTQSGADENYARDFLKLVRIRDSAEGYFQFVVLEALAGQFQLRWHGGYDDTMVVCNRAGLEKALAAADDFVSTFDHHVPDSVRQAAMSIDLEPTVEFSEDTATVRLVTFTKWGGLAEHRRTISRAFPHEVLGESVEWLVEYDCGIVF